MATKYFAFFTKGPRNVAPYEGHPKDVWVNTVRREMHSPYAEVVLIEHSEWNAPTLKSNAESEVRKNNLAIYTGMRRVLLDTYGLPQPVVDYGLMHKLSIIPLLDSQRVIAVYPHPVQ